MTGKPHFTPGPWHVFDKTKVGTGKEFVADCECMGVYFERSVDEANAAMIAAAPEMYAKLAWMQKQFDASDDEELVALGWEIEDLLKKARGEK